MDRQLMIALLTAVSAGGLLYVFVYPYLSGDARVRKRHAVLTAATSDRKGTGRGGVSSDPAKRRKAIAESLKEIEEKNKVKKYDLEQRIAQAGLSVSKQSFVLAAIGFGLLFGLVLFALNRQPLVGAGGVLVGIFGIPNWFLGFLRKRRLAKFIEEFPGAVDVIIRGVKAGLPVGDCFRIVASEGQEPVRSEFRTIIEGQAIGLSIGEAVDRFADRVPVSEASFFSIVINIQQKAGGNLSETLSNLSRVLRERKKMKAKIQAMSSEAKASASIIGSLPFLVAGAVYLTTPSYMALLFSTTTGNLIIGGCLLWMSIGVFIMSKMINFNI